ncbi:hypothetical protein LTR86_008669 [Recurvomyces mirabilis]|nr:hypothetical protein LTR86_008669 [Recurvomyces mirabilis]
MRSVSKQPDSPVHVSARISPQANNFFSNSCQKATYDEKCWHQPEVVQNQRHREGPKIVRRPVEEAPELCYPEGEQLGDLLQKFTKISKFLVSVKEEEEDLKGGWRLLIPEDHASGGEINDLRAVSINAAVGVVTQDECHGEEGARSTQGRYESMESTNSDEPSTKTLHVLIGLYVLLSSVLDYLPLASDAIGLARLSLETRHNRFARLFIERHANKIIDNHVETRKYICKGPAFRGESKEVNKRAVVMMTRGRHQGQDKPGSAARKALGIRTNRCTYTEIEAHSQAGDTCDYLRTSTPVETLQKQLIERRQPEENVRYFAPDGKAEFTLSQFNSLLDGRVLLCHGCLHDGPMNRTSEIYNLGLLCTTCVDVLFQQRLVRLTTLHQHDVYTFDEFTAKHTRTLDNGTKFLTMKQQTFFAD